MHLKVHYIFVAVNSSKFFAKSIMVNQSTFKRLLAAVYNFQNGLGFSNRLLLFYKIINS